MPSGQPSASQSYPWLVCCILALCLAFSYMDRTVFNLLIIPIEKDFHLDDTTISLVQGTSFALFYALFGLPLARVADTWHRRNLIIIGVLIWCSATVGCGLAVGPVTLFASRVLVAMGEAVLMPSAVSILADYFSSAHRSRAMNVYSMGIQVGGGLLLAIGALILHSVGEKGFLIPMLGTFSAWRMVFIVLGLSGLLLIPLLLLIREPERLDAQGRLDRAQLPLGDVVRVFAEHRAAIFCTVFGFALLAMGAQSMQAWTPTLFVRLHGWSTSSIGLRLGIITLVMGPLGAITGSIIAEHFAKRGHVNSKLGVGAASALLCSVAAFGVTMAGSGGALVASALLQFFVCFNFGLIQASLAEILPNRARGMGTATYVATSSLLNAILGPLAVGALTDHYFHNPDAVGLSLQIVAPTSFVLSACVLAWGLKPVRQSIARVTAGNASLRELA